MDNSAFATVVTDRLNKHTFYHIAKRRENDKLKLDPLNIEELFGSGSAGR